MISPLLKANPIVSPNFKVCNAVRSVKDRPHVISLSPKRPATAGYQFHLQRMLFHFRTNDPS
jgi:hypothetical protein